MKIWRITFWIEKVFAMPMDAPMRTQNSFDIAETRERQAEIKEAPFVAKADARPVSPS